MVLHGHHLGSGLVEQLGCHGAHIAEALHSHACALDVHAEVAGGFRADHEHAAAGSLVTAQRPAQRDRLAGHHAGGRAARVHRVGIHHPGHDLGVGIHVRRRNILGRADDQVDFTGVAARQAFQFGRGERARIHADAALCTTVGHIDGGILDRHPRRQGHHLGQRHVLVETHAALAGAAREVVLHAIALVVGDGAVVQFDGHVHDQRTLGALQRFHPAGQRAQVGRDAVDLLEVDAPGPERVGVQVRRQGVGGDGRLGRCCGRHR
ncbi:hypothetical protein D3C86_1401660 [compost metagenome]